MTLSDEVRIALDGKWRHVREQSRKELGEIDLALRPRPDPRRGPLRGARADAKLVPTGIPGGRLQGRERRHRRSGHGRHRHRDAGAVRPLAHGQGRRPVGPVRRSDREPRHQAAPRPLHPRPDQPRPARLLRDDRDRPWQRRAEPRDHRDVRPGDPGVRDQLADAVVAQGLHRRCRSACRGRRRVRAAHHQGREPRRALLRRAAA